MPSTTRPLIRSVAARCAAAAVLLSGPAGRALADADLLSVVARDRGDDRVELLLCRPDADPAPIPALDGTRWSAITPRLPDRSRPGRRLGLESVSKGALRALRVRDDYVLVVFAAGTPAVTRSGFAAVGVRFDGGARVLLEAADARYVPSGGAWEMTSDGGKLATVVEGSGGDSRAIVIVELAGEEPLAHVIDLPDTPRIRPDTFRLTDAGAVYFGGDVDSKESYFYRIAPGESAPQAIAGPFEETPSSAVLAGETVAFLGGDDKRLLDIYAAAATGAAIRVTDDSSEILPNDEGGEHLAISPDGCYVAFNRVFGSEPELFLTEVCEAVAASQITKDSHFNPYIDQENWIFFFNGSVVFAAGHSNDTTDLFRVPLDGIDGSINLTQTGSSLAPPFLDKGTLFIGQIAWGSASYLVSATTPGVAGSSPDPALYAVSPDDGRINATGLSMASLFVDLGASQYFAAHDPSTGSYGVYRVTGMDAPTLVAASPRAPELLLASTTRAIYLVHGTGFVDARAGAEPTLIPLETPITGATVSVAEDGSAAYALAYGEGGETLLVDLSQPGLVAVGEPLAGTALDFAIAGSVGPPFVRGDANSDGGVDIADALRILGFLFQGQGAPGCLDAADVDDDGAVTITDPVRVLLWLFRSGASPIPAPFPDAGTDPSPDALGCAGV